MAGAFIVTGAAGFIGSRLCAGLLARGGRIVGVDSFDPFYDRGLKEANLRWIEAAAAEAGRFRIVEADICDAPAMRDLAVAERPHAVFHLAALAGVRPSIAEPARFADVNVQGTISMLEAARAADCRPFIFASSSSVYGNNEKVPFAEDDRVDEPVSPYAATKKAGELLCHTCARLYGLRIAALRYFTVFGPAQRPDLAIAKFMRLIAAGEEIPMFGDGSTSRDYTYVDDVIAGTLAAYDTVVAADPGFFRIYNLGGSSPVRLSEMIERIGRVVGRTPRVTQLPLQPGDVQRTWADLARSRAELGYEPTTPFDEGLERQWRWLRGQLEGIA